MAFAGTRAWLRLSPPELVWAALIVGAGGGLGAVGFRWLTFAVTWLATGHEQFGQQGRVGSLHFPWLGIGFLVVIPVAGGLLYGPLIYRFAREARGHGVPEVMIAVATERGRIRPQVSVVKALASALCIGAGGSVGREGPIVQIGSALASSLGQLMKMPGSKLRVLVACGAAAGISATFNAPATGVLFGFELILREFTLDALVPMMLASVVADLVGRAFFGSAPIFSQLPHDLVIPHNWQYLLVVVLGLAAAFIGTGFHAILYKVEDICDAAWKNRPEWARPAAGGVLLGLVLLALPQLYGVGYPVMTQAIAGNEALWFLLILMAGKMLAASLTIGIGGSGGVFAPSLFTGAMAGTAFGVVAGHLFGPAAGPPAVYGIIAMGAVFAAAARAPLTSTASVAEMTGNYGLILPVMLAVAVAAGLAGRLSYGTIYTRKLLRRGIDIDLHRRAATQPEAPPVHDAARPTLSQAGAGPDGGRAAGRVQSEAPLPARSATTVCQTERQSPRPAGRSRPAVMNARQMARDERADLAAFLATLAPGQWQAPTLCTGWRVRDIVAHLICYDELGIRGLLPAVIRGRFRSARVNAIAIADFRTRSPDQLLSLLRKHLEPRGLPGALGGRVALVEGIIHHQDIRRGLGQPRTVPPERLLLALRWALLAPDIGSLWQVRGVRLVATDLDFQIGAGPEVRGSAEALLMTVACRRGVVGELSGPGQAKLAKRLNHR